MWRTSMAKKKKIGKKAKAKKATKKKTRKVVKKSTSGKHAKAAARMIAQMKNLASKLDVLAHAADEAIAALKAEQKKVKNQNQN